MSENKPPILCRPLIAPKIYDFLRVKAFDEHIQFSELVVKYVKLGIEKDNLTTIKKYEYNGEYPNYKDVYLPEQCYNFIINKAEDIQVGTGTLFMNYLMLGIKEEKVKSAKSLHKWFESLNSVD